jgi:hypothetical protein
LGDCHASSSSAVHPKNTPPRPVRRDEFVIEASNTLSGFTNRDALIVS